MEVLVVLVLASMISTLLMQGFSYVLNLRVRFLARVEDQTTGLLQSHWLTGVTAGLIPCHPDDGVPFKGEAARFQGLSLAALTGTPGVPTTVTLEWLSKDGDSILQYREDQKEPMEIGRWVVQSGSDEAAGFTYLDEQGGRHKQWPPSLGMFPQLPRAILLEVRAIRGPMAWLIPMSGRYEPKPTLKDLLPPI